MTLTLVVPESIASVHTITSSSWLLCITLWLLQLSQPRQQPNHSRNFSVHYANYGVFDRHDVLYIDL